MYENFKVVRFEEKHWNNGNFIFYTYFSQQILDEWVTWHVISCNANRIIINNKKKDYEI